MKKIFFFLPFALTACVGTSTSTTSAPTVSTTITNKSTQFAVQTAQTFLPLNSTLLESNQITVNDQQTYQSLRGFGAALTDSSAYVISQLPESQQNIVLNNLFGRESGIGINYIRLPVSATDFSLYSYTYDDMPAGQTDPNSTYFNFSEPQQYTIPLLHKILAINPEIKILITPWTAPGWMKNTDNLLGQSSSVDSWLLPQYYANYAAYLVKVIQNYRLNGIPVTAMTVQNEPLFAPSGYPGMLMEQESQSNFINNFLTPAFEQNDIKNISIFAYDHNWDNIYYPEYVLNNLTESAAKYVVGAAFHCYAGDVESQSVFHQAEPHASIMMTECAGGDWAPDWSSNFVWDMQNVFMGAVNNWAEGSLKWNIALNQNDGPTNGGCTNCRGLLTVNNQTNLVSYNEDYYAVGVMSKYFLPGAIRIGVSPNNQNLLATAAINPDGSHVVAVLNQASDNSLQNFSLIWNQQYIQASVPPNSVAVYTWH